MIYLCSVYSLNADEELMERRAKYARTRTAEFLNQEIPVFSPIAHCHEISKENKMPGSWDFWEILDYQYIDACDEIWVLQMPGWQESTGITAEIKYAKSLKKPIKYIPCEDYNEL